MLLKPVVKEELEEHIEAEPEKDEEYEQLFENMETILDTKKRKSERVVSAKTKKKKC